VELPEGEGFSTVAGLCIHLAERIPAAGDSFSLAEGWSLRVEDANARRVRAVRLIPPPPKPAVADDEG
jgi:putative hemolysin